MRTKKTISFTSIRVEGHILPADLVQRISSGDSMLGGLTPDSFHLQPNEKINEATTQAWNRLQGFWTSFRSARSKLKENDPGTTVTRERWLLPLFQELGYGRLPGAKAIELEGKTYPISHRWSDIPIHLVGFNVVLDKVTAGVAGAAKTSPHSFVQELLNRSEESLWGFVSNGLRLRILRDNVNFVRQSFVEFDLESMMEGEAYSDFVLLWLLCHQSRVEGGRKEDYWLEKWSKTAQEQGVRALDSLRQGVEAAIKALGKGFLAHRTNAELKERLRSGDLDKQNYYRQILRLVYRLLFLFVAEDRELLLDPESPDIARDRFTKYYSTARIRRLAEKRFGSRHEDLFISLRLVMEKLGSDEGCPELGLPALGSFLFSYDAVVDIGKASIANHDLLDAIRALAFVEDRGARRQVDYKNLGSEELGSVYESLLELNPELNIAAATFDLKTLSGNERKTSGSYYTPTNLINALLDSALDPVIEKALKTSDPQKALLDLKVCDPACGSGHFLVAAAHRVAKHLAALNTGTEEPSPEAVRHALRDVVGSCIYGVDINPMSVELCKVSLWMEALEPGKPLSFLDHHIRVGNSLLGTTPALLRQGIPDDAFKPIEGDDRELCAEYKKQNKREKQQDLLLGFGGDLWENLGDFATAMVNLKYIPDKNIKGVKKRQEHYESLTHSNGYLLGELLADAWCAAFVWKKNRESGFPYAITEEEFRKIRKSPSNISPWIRDEIIRLSQQYKFFHWHLAFPDVFRVPTENEIAENEQAGWIGGFDCILGNPPWERTAFEELEFFASRSQEIVNATTTAQRKKLISNLSHDNPNLFREYAEAKREADGENHLFTNSNRYPLGTSGRINTYALFTDLSLSIVSKAGKVGIIVQTGIATDAPMEPFWRYLTSSGRLISLIDFENKKRIFPGVHAEQKFCLLVVDGGNRPQGSKIRIGFWLTDLTLLNDPERVYDLSLSKLTIISPNTNQPPVARSKRDFELITKIHNATSILYPNDEINPRAKAWRALMTAGSSEHFKTEDQLENGIVNNDSSITLDDKIYLPLIEAKQIHQFDFSFATYASTSKEMQKSGNPRLIEVHERDAYLHAIPRFWGAKHIVDEMYKAKNWNKNWIMGVRDVTNVNNERTAIVCVLPRIGLIQPLNAISCHNALDALAIAGAVNSFVVDYIARQKISGRHLNVTIFSQLPAPPIGNDESIKLAQRNVLELTYTNWHLKDFAEECGYIGPPFRWNENRRYLLRCELDALYFHLYGVSQADVDYIMETFPIIKRKDETVFGEYRTKRLILEIYDEMMTGGSFSLENYRTRLNPPPAFLSIAHHSSKQPYGLVLPQEKRYPLENNQAYLMLVVFTALQETKGSIKTEQLINICKLLAMPDKLEQNGKIIDSEISHQWRSQFCDTLQPNLFLLTLRDLVDRGHIKFVPDNESSRIILVDAPDFKVSPHIQFDVRLALAVSKQLASAKLEELPEIVTDSEIRSLYAA